MTTPCRCIEMQPIYVHGGHCCLCDWDDPDPAANPPCHPEAWQHLKETNR